MYEKYEELGSIIKYFYENHNDKGNINLYYEEVPKDFKEPSLYFPTPIVSSNNFSLESFQNSFMWFIKIFDKTTLKVQETAMEITNNLAGQRYLIPIYNADGAKTNRYIRINNVNLRKIDMGVIQIELEFNLAYFFNTPDYVKFTKFYTKNKLKED